MKTTLLAACCALALSTAAQGGFNKNDFKTVSGSLFYATITGEPINTTKYVQLVAGTPYFQDGWMQSIIVLKNGNRTQNIPARLNLLENEIYFRDSKGSELIVSQPVQEIVLMNAAEDSLFRFVHASTLGAADAKKGWYQWLYSGKASLYKYYQKELFETKPYGSASAEQRVTTKERYYVLYNGNLVAVKSLKELPSVLKEKKAELETFIKKLPAGGSTEDKMILALTYFNSLVH